MRVVIDGIIFQKDPHSGIARLYRELLPRLCDLSPELEISLFIDGPIQSEIPLHRQIHLKSAPALRLHIRPKGHWRQIYYPIRRAGSRIWNTTRQIWLGSGKGEIWHSTFFTYLPGWRGREIVTVHDMAPERFKDVFTDPMDAAGRDQKKRCVERAVEIICDSYATKIELEAEYPMGEKKISVIPLSHSKAFRVFQEKQPADFDQLTSPFLLYVGSRAHYKNFRFLLYVYANWDQREQIHLAVVGPSWNAEEKRVIEALGLKDLVHNTGHVSDIVLCRLYNSAAALVFPSIIEGFGLPLLEAMACGCPIVASKIPSTTEVAADCPAFFDLKNPNALTHALDRVIQEGRNSPRVCTGLDRAASFSWDRTAQATLEVYKRASRLIIEK